MRNKLKTEHIQVEQELIIYVIELLGTFAFAISGIRHAAAKHFDASRYAAPCWTPNTR